MPDMLNLLRNWLEARVYPFKDQFRGDSSLNNRAILQLNNHFWTRLRSGLCAIVVFLLVTLYYITRLAFSYNNEIIIITLEIQILCLYKCINNAKILHNCIRIYSRKRDYFERERERETLRLRRVNTML